MGIGVESVNFINHVHTNLGVRFDRTAMIGRQAIYTGNHAEPFFHSLGAIEVVSFDISDYEKAERIHDFNLPLGEEFHNRFSAVFDGGTLEHIFNYPQALANCLKMVEVGGHFLTITPTNNYSSHGFYQFSPDLFFRTLNPSNGFSLRLMGLCEAGKLDWIKITDPAITGGVEAVRVNDILGETVLMVVAQKIADMPLFADVHQSCSPPGGRSSGIIPVWKNQ